jgi:hypothetical protein
MIDRRGTDRLRRLAKSSPIPWDRLRTADVP